MALTLHGTVSDNTVALDRKTATPLIMNGDMAISQRGTSAAGITATGYYTIDRFLIGKSGLGTWTQSQSTDVPSSQGFSNSLKLDCTTAVASPASSNNLAIAHRFEGQNLQMLKKGTSSAESVTISFWVKSNKTGTYILEVRDTDNSRIICKAYTIDSANTWEKKVLSFAGDTTGALDNDNNSSFLVRWWLGAGSDFTSGTLATSWEASTNANRAVGQTVNLADSTDNEWYITGVQMEVGTFDANSIPPFQFEDVGTSLARCQRYYFEYSGNTAYRFSTGYVLSSTQSWHVVYSPTTMRANPDLSYVNFDVRDPSNAGIPSSIAIAQVGPNEIYLVTAITGGTAGNGCQFRAYADNAYMKFSAEL